MEVEEKKPLTQHPKEQRTVIGLAVQANGWHTPIPTKMVIHVSME